jgi:prevent-host-death family protein
MPIPDQTETITSSQLQQQIGTMLKRVAIRGEHLTVSTNGFPVAVILPIGDYQTLLQEHQQLHASIERSVE